MRLRREWNIGAWLARVGFYVAVVAAQGVMIWRVAVSPAVALAAQPVMGFGVLFAALLLVIDVMLVAETIGTARRQRALRGAARGDDRAAPLSKMTLDATDALPAGETLRFRLTPNDPTSSGMTVLALVLFVVALGLSGEALLLPLFPVAWAWVMGLPGDPGSIAMPPGLAM